MPEIEQSHKASAGGASTAALRPAWRELEPSVAQALRPALPALADEVIEAVSAAVPEYRAGVDENVRLGVRQALDGFVELVVTGSEARLPERQIYVDFGRGEYRVGRSLDALLRAYRAGAQVAWRGLARAGDAAGIAPRQLYTLAEAIFAYIDEISAASAEGFALEQSVALSERQARRQRLVELMLSEPPATTEAVETAARDAGWTLPDALAVLAFEAERPERVAARLPDGSLLAEVEDLSVAIVPDPDGPGRPAQLERAIGRGAGGLGHTVKPPQAHESARRAQLALRLARQRDGGLVLAADNLLDLLLAADPAIAADLADRRLAPLRELPEGRAARLQETLAAWLDAHGDVRQTADALHVHVQTVRYRLGQLRDLYDGALGDPGFRLELALALRAPAEDSEEA